MLLRVWSINTSLLHRQHCAITIMTFKDTHNMTDQSSKSGQLQLSDVTKPEHQPAPDSLSEHPSMKRVALIMCSIYITMFLIALVSSSRSLFILDAI